MAIGIGEVARISPVKRLLGGLHDGRARFACLFHDFIHLASLRDVVADRERCAAGRRFRQTAIVSQIVLIPDRKFDTVRKIKERDSAMLEFATHDPWVCSPSPSR